MYFFWHSFAAFFLFCGALGSFLLNQGPCVGRGLLVASVPLAIYMLYCLCHIFPCVLPLWVWWKLDLGGVETPAPWVFTAYHGWNYPYLASCQCSFAAASTAFLARQWGPADPSAGLLECPAPPNPALKASPSRSMLVPCCVTSMSSLMICISMYFMRFLNGCSCSPAASQPWLWAQFAPYCYCWPLALACLLCVFCCLLGLVLPLWLSLDLPFAHLFSWCCWAFSQPFYSIPWVPSLLPSLLTPSCFSCVALPCCGAITQSVLSLCRALWPPLVGSLGVPSAPALFYWHLWCPRLLEPTRLGCLGALLEPPLFVGPFSVPAWHKRSLLVSCSVSSVVIQ